MDNQMNRVKGLFTVSPHHPLTVSPTHLVTFLLLFGTVNVAFAGTTGAPVDLDTDTLRPFLKTHCVRCHGPEEQNADRRLDQLSFDFSDPENGELWQEVLDQLNLGEMPPKDEPQPSAEQLRTVVAILTKTMATARDVARGHSAGRVVLRRLNRTEYLNTVRDLFQMDMTDFDPTVAFPADDSIEGFDNIGEGLLTSDFLLAQYLQAAERVIEKAIRPGPRPSVEHIISEGDAIHGGGHSDQRGFKRALVRDRFTRAYVKRKYAGVPADGEYILRIRANTVRWRDHRFDLEELGYDPSQPPRIRVLVTNRGLGTVATRTFGEYDIRDGEPVDIEVRGFLQEGFEFAVEWANGPRGSQKRIMRKVFPKYLPEDTVFMARNPVEMYMGAAPELRLHRLELEGPHYDQWPLPSFARFFGDVPEKPTAEDLQRCLARFASFAWRSPADPPRLERYLKLATGRFEQTGDFWLSARLGMRALLASPGFLYLVEPQESAVEARLSDYELATRLSYFLWSSMPDDALFALARRGELSTPDVLAGQVDRMLSDSKAAAFSKNFSGQWLGLRRLGEMPPDPEMNKSYYADNLEWAMREETLRLFNHLLSHNETVLGFVDARYTFLNPALARHYGIEGVDAVGFQRVALRSEDRRGGLLGHGSILTLTSNGVETQPVVRGIWVLENLLGTPPSPPPPDVQPVEPDTRGVTTIRELMAKHRTIETCNECHRKIDPIGLAMENFDHLGRFRTRYAKNSPIDPSGEMPDGSKFDGPAGIRSYLLARPQQFTRCLTEKLMIYALGRRLAFTDRDDIDRVVVQSVASGYGFRDLVKFVVASRAFQSK
jgi:mono/diheme cytochrome c family protein